MPICPKCNIFYIGYHTTEHCSEFQRENLENRRETEDMKEALRQMQRDMLTNRDPFAGLLKKEKESGRWHE